MNVTLRKTGDGVVLGVKVVPNSSRSQIVGALGNLLKLKVAAPPEAGKANAAVIALLARTFGVPDAQIEITAGHSQARKRVLIRHGNEAEVTAALRAILEK